VLRTWSWLAVVCAAVVAWAEGGAQPPVSILKLDDVRQVKTGTVHPSWLRAQHCTFMTPSEYLNSLQKGKP